jgi:hypothetical protein
MSTTSVYMKEETASRDRLIKSRDRQLFIVRGKSDLAGDTEVVRDTPADASKQQTIYSLKDAPK